jgi:hypothetical protein
MNSDLATWGLFAARLAFETLLIIGSAAVASQFIRHPTMHRSLWQGLLVALAILWSVELLDLRPSRPTAGIGTSTAERSAPEVSVRQAYSPEAARSSQPSAGTPPTITDPPSPSAKTPESESESTHSVVWPGWLWIAGMSCVLGNILFKRLQLFLWIRSTRCRRDLIRSPWRIIESTELCGPVAFGIWRPTIALPAEFAERFTAPQRDAMVAHEMAHLDGRDPAWCLLSDLLCAVAWWHPGVWWVRNRFRAAAESAADTVAATMIPGGHMALAEALVTLGRDLALGPWFEGTGRSGKRVPIPTGSSRDPPARRFACGFSERATTFTLLACRQCDLGCHRSLPGNDLASSDLARGCAMLWFAEAPPWWWFMIRRPRRLRFAVGLPQPCLQCSGILSIAAP